MRSIKYFFIFLIMATIVYLPSIVLADTAQTTKKTAETTPATQKKTGLQQSQTNLGKVTKSSGLSFSLESTIGTVIKGALSLVGTIFLILTVYAGILWMTARGDDSQVEKSQNIIRASIIGLFITLSAYAITYYITNRLSV